jgi:NADH dehydrogenase [ubiquinone] 1 alpha subcomplex assembly factor 7
VSGSSRSPAVKASPERGAVADRLARLIDSSGPISVAQYMAEANAHYYATRDPLGVAGDFTTAPEISQMFGELIGLWLADLWSRAGSPADVCYVELGPGRGTLAADALRAMRSAGLGPSVHFVETSSALRAEQAKRVPQASWHDDVGSLPEDAPLLIVANEFFDALPVRQIVATEKGWRERLVAHREGCFLPVAGPPVGAAGVPEQLREAPPGTIMETSPASVSIMRQIADLIARAGGAALIVDYGHVRTSSGETLQAVAMHDYADPWIEPGERDLTAHVDFEALGAAASEYGVRVFGPTEQGRWLEAIGIGLRAEALARAAPERAEEFVAARHRLTSPQEMGTLFKAMALVSPGWPEPAGFA